MRAEYEQLRDRLYNNLRNNRLIRARGQIKQDVIGVLSKLQDIGILTEEEIEKSNILHEVVSSRLLSDRQKLGIFEVMVTDYGAVISTQADIDNTLHLIIKNQKHDLLGSTQMRNNPDVFNIVASSRSLTDHQKSTILEVMTKRFGALIDSREGVDNALHLLAKNNDSISLQMLVNSEQVRNNPGILKIKNAEGLTPSEIASKNHQKDSILILDFAFKEHSAKNPEEKYKAIKNSLSYRLQLDYNLEESITNLLENLGKLGWEDTKVEKAKSDLLYEVASSDCIDDRRAASILEIMTKRFGAQIDTPEGENNALHLLAKMNQHESLEILVNSEQVRNNPGILKIKNDDGLTPLDVASQEDSSKESAEILRNASRSNEASKKKDFRDSVKDQRSNEEKDRGGRN